MAVTARTLEDSPLRLLPRTDDGKGVPGNRIREVALTPVELDLINARR